jgi:hypothetical protein
MAWLSCFALTATCKVGLAPCLVLSCLLPSSCLIFICVVYHLHLCLVFFVSCLVLSCLALPCHIFSCFVASRLVLFVSSDLYLFFAGDADVHKQRAWLQAVLGTSTATFKIVFFHHPPFSSSQHDELADWMVALSYLALPCLVVSCYLVVFLPVLVLFCFDRIGLSRSGALRWSSMDTSMRTRESNGLPPRSQTDIVLRTL